MEVITKIFSPAGPFQVVHINKITEKTHWVMGVLYVNEI